MHTENVITMNAPADRIFEVASNVLDWPRILPHYRFVRLIRDDGPSKVVEMAAHRDGIPVKWTSILEPVAAEHRIIFRHIKGPTTGMYVEWTMQEAADGTVIVRIAHEFKPPVFMPEFIAKHVIGEFFVHNIASKTLATIKKLVEAENMGAKSDAGE